MELIDVDKFVVIGNFLFFINGSVSFLENIGLSLNLMNNELENIIFGLVFGFINVGYILFDGLWNFRNV